MEGRRSSPFTCRCYHYIFGAMDGGTHTILLLTTDFFLVWSSAVVFVRFRFETGGSFGTVDGSRWNVSWCARDALA
jgi:hypothetical protein